MILIPRCLQRGGFILNQVFFCGEGIYEEVSADWQFIITSDNNKTNIWKISDGNLLLSVGGIYEEVSADWQFIITSNCNRTNIWKISDNELFLSFVGEHIEINLDKKIILIVGNYNDGFYNGKSIEAWKLTDNHLDLLFSDKQQYDYPEEEKYCDLLLKEVSLDWQFIATFSYLYLPNNHSIYRTRVWKTISDEEIFWCEGRYIAASPNWEFIITFDDDNRKTDIWRVADKTLLLSIQDSYVQVSHNSQLVITSCNEYVKVWRIIDSKLLLSVQGQYEEISPNGEFIVISYNKYVEVCRVVDGKLLLSVQGQYKEISSNWQFIIISSNTENLEVWRIADSKLLFSVEGKYKESREVSLGWQLITIHTAECRSVWDSG